MGRKQRNAEGFRQRIAELMEQGMDIRLARLTLIYRDVKEALEENLAEGEIGRDDSWEKEFYPEYIDGKDPGGVYDINPVRVKISDRIDWYDDVEEIKGHHVAVQEEWFDTLLVEFFIESLPAEAEINLYRYSTVEDPEGVYIRGFDWYVHYNFYNREDMRTIIRKLRAVASRLRKHEIEALGKKQLLQLETYRMKENGTDQIPKGMMERIAEFYEKFAERLQRMINECIEADFFAVSFL